MIACMPTSDSWSSREREGETMLCPAVPIKSPMRLMSGLRSLALEVAPPYVCGCVPPPMACVCVNCAASEVGAGVAGLAARVLGSMRADASRTRASGAGSGDFAPRITCSSPVSTATCSASVRTWSSKALIRASCAIGSAGAAGTGACCAYAVNPKQEMADTITNFFIALLPYEIWWGRGPRLGIDGERGRRARRDGARNVGGDDEAKAASFQAVSDRQRSNRERVCQHRRTGRAAHGTEMVRGWRGSEVGAKMELRAKEDDREEHCQDANAG